MDVLVLAGGKSSPSDPLYDLSQGGLKSMVSIAGKPMVQWVLDAISGSSLVDQVVLIGVEESSALSCKKDVTFLPDEGSLLGNIYQGARFLEKIHPQQSHMVSISADIPTISSEMIDHMIRIYQEQAYDIYYSVVEREVLEKRFPESKRTYIRLKDGEVCGGDLNAYSKQAAMNPDGLWTQLIGTRKNPLKQAALIGFDTLFLIYLKQLTLDQAAGRVCRRLGIKGKALRVPFAEIGMDVDKPFQFEMVQKELMR